MITYNKLVRDKIPELITQKWEPCERHIANDKEYRKALIQKLQEEVNEFLEDNTEEELWDILEVIYAIDKYKWRNVENARKQKKEKKWWFDKKIILERS